MNERIQTTSNMCVLPRQWPRSSVCPSLNQLRPVPSRRPAPSTSCPCCCASDSAAVICPSCRRFVGTNRCSHKKKKRQAHTNKYAKEQLYLLSLCAQTLDSSELQGDGIVLSLEEQLNALSLSAGPSPSGPDPKDTVALNGTRFPSQLFEDARESTKVSSRNS